LLEKINAKIRVRHPHLSLLKYSGSKEYCTVQGDCGHSWEAKYDSIYGSKGGYTCRTCYPVKANITAKKDTITEANTKLGKIFQDLVYLEYKGYNELATIKNNTCGHEWQAKPKDITSKHSGFTCRICNPIKLNLTQANERLSILFSDLEFIDYNGLQVPANIRSKTCGHTWVTTLNNITTGNTPATCPTCYPRVSRVSKGEKEVLDYIKSIYSGWVIENDRLNISPYELDIVIPDLGIAIEYNGDYFHSDNRSILTLLDKSNMLQDMQLIHIFESEWLNKQEIVKSRIASILGKSHNRIYARNCYVKKLDYFPSTYLEDNHIQGAGAPTSINLGLYTKDSNLISVMTFSKPRFTVDKDYELVRYCSSLNTSVIGGASKLLKYFKSNYKGSIISYSDKRWSTGKLYSTLGFKYSHTSAPNYRYVKGVHTLSRYKCQKHLLANLFPQHFDPSLSESEIMARAGYYKVFDCGSDVWVLANY